MVYYTVQSAAEELGISPRFLRLLSAPDTFRGSEVYPTDTVDELRHKIPTLGQTKEGRQVLLTLLNTRRRIEVL
jgi:hypothetical protein